MKTYFLLPVILFSFFSTLKAQSELFLDTTYTVEEMVMDFFDNPGIIVSNVTSAGSPLAIAFFDAGGTDLGLDAGIFFSSGNVLYGIGPNTSGGITGSFNLPGDNDIDSLGGALSEDAYLIEFDFTVDQSDTLDFNYVFGSEEYPEFVGSVFNDAFGFFISGPGINGPYSNNAENISLLPGTDTTVAINNVNEWTNSQYYINNISGEHISYDGFTVPLPASFYAEAGNTYHIKMVIADRGDTSFDSGIFLSFNSLGQDSLLSPSPDFQFSFNSNGVEFINESKYARSWLWDFGNGETSNERYPDPVYYDIGDYTISLTTQNYCCTEVYSTIISIEEPFDLSTTITASDLLCFGDENASIDLQIQGGVLPYASIDWAPSIADLNNVGAGTYTYTVIDAVGSTITGSITIESPSPIVIETQAMNEIDMQSNGSATANVSGGIEPYEFLWSTGSTAPSIINQSAGNYIVTVTDANDCSRIQEITIGHEFTPISVSAATTNNPLACFGDTNASISLEISGGFEPYTIEWTPFGSDLSTLGAGTYSITVSDDNGQIENIEITITQPDVLELIFENTPATGNNMDGTATVFVTGGASPYEYLWSNGATESSIGNLAPGDYSLILTDANGCTVNRLVTIESVTNLFEHNDFLLNLYPNPVQDHLFLEWSEQIDVEQLEVFDVLGQVIPLSYQLLGNKISIQLDKQIAGTYYLQLKVKDGRKGAISFVID